jgi:predicted ATPase/DNA-binding XRE family transcriptional regulator
MVKSFAALLRTHRLSAQFSQETLAEAARVSVSAIGAYERGVRVSPHRETVGLLADALQLTATDRAFFEAAARRRTGAGLGAVPNGTRRTNLPVETTSFIGHERDLEQIAELLRAHRLVTLIGSGGIGKSRTALRVAGRFRSLPHGFWVIDVSSLDQAALIGPALASVLNLRFTGSFEDLLGALKDRNLLLILDNCEHLVSAVGEAAAAILRTCPHVRLLATSRERLRIGGEVVYQIPPLPVPSTLPETAEETLRYPAVQLFVERAMLGNCEFAYTDDRRQAVVEICRQLDGIPLAIELAASQLALLGIHALRKHLVDYLAIVSAGNRDLPSRQQTLRSTLAWSYDLLTNADRVLCRRLGAFPGSFRVDDVLAVCAGDGLSECDALRALSSLIEKSIVFTIADGQDVARYRMPNVVRLFAIEKAAQADEAPANDLRYAIWLVGQKPGSEDASWINSRLASLDWGQRPREAAYLLQALLRTQTGDELNATAERAIGVLTAIGDAIGLAECWLRLAEALERVGQAARAQAARNCANALFIENASEPELEVAKVRA